MTTLTLDLSPDMYHRLNEEAHRQGKPIEAVAEALLAERLAAQGSEREHATEILRAAGLRAIRLTQNHRLRGYDAVHLAAALIANEQYLSAGLPGLTFVAADDDLVTPAQIEGLATDNPNLHL